MSPQPPSVQRSFRLSASTSELVDQLVEASGESRTSVVERLLAEAVRTERHPLVRFRAGAAGRREPGLVGTRLLVRQVIGTVRASEGMIDEAAEYLGITESEVQATVAYYAEFAHEVDADQECADRLAANERARWEREQAALA